MLEQLEPHNAGEVRPLSLRAVPHPNSADGSQMSIRLWRRNKLPYPTSTKNGRRLVGRGRNVEWADSFTAL